MFRIAPYRDEYRPEIIRLMGSVPGKAQIWHWQFQQNPYGYRFDPVVLKDGERVVGFNGVMAVDVLCNNSRKRVLWSCDFYVDRDYRGKGLGRMIKDALHEKSADIMSFGISKMAAPVLLKMGWKSSSEVHVFRRYSTFDSYRKALVCLLQQVSTLRGSLARRRGSSLEFRLSGSLPDPGSVDELWERAGPGYRKIVVRNHAYLHWRYECHPLAGYRFIHILERGRLRAVGVLRQGRAFTYLVDLLACADDRAARNAVVAAMLAADKSRSGFSCTTSDPLLSSCLQDHGFFRARKQPRFFVRSADPDDAACEQGWFIMGGDSDGDMLAAARETDELRISVITDAEEFRSLQADWNGLLGRSRANRLFLGWAWQYSWWETWGESLGLRLFLVTAWRGKRLVGIAPLYLDRVALAGRLPGKRLQFIGNAFRKHDTVRTEYLEFITERESADEICEALAAEIGKSRLWDEFVLCDMRNDSPTCRALRVAGNRYGWFSFIRELDMGVRIDTSGEFADYLSGLGKNTRLKMIGHRKYLHKLGPVATERAELNTLDEYFALLNRFHRERWGKDCFAGDSLHFHKRFLQRHVPNGKYAFEIIRVDGKPISAIYDISAGDTVFNLQSGFDATFDSKLSPGTLHMGLAIEEAFADPEIRAFDLLAGRGRRRFYKAHFNGDIIEFHTLQIARRRLLKLIYRIYLLVPGRFSSRARGSKEK